MTSNSQPPLGTLDRVAYFLLRGVTLICDALGVILLASVMLLIVAAVLARDLLGLGMPWTEEVASMLWLSARSRLACALNISL